MAFNKNGRVYNTSDQKLLNEKYLTKQKLDKRSADHLRTSSPAGYYFRTAKGYLTKFVCKVFS